MNIQGRIKHIGQIEFFGQNGFQKRDLVITTEEQYPQQIIIQFTQDKCTLLDSLNLGQNVNVHFNLRGREWTNPQGEIKYFNTLEGWKIELIQVAKVTNQGYQMPNNQNPSYQNPNYQNPSHQVPNNQNSVGANHYSPEQPPMGYAPTPSQAPQYQQTSAFDSYGQAPTQSEVEDDLPF